MMLLLYTVSHIYKCVVLRPTNTTIWRCLGLLLICFERHMAYYEHVLFDEWQKYYNILHALSMQSHPLFCCPDTVTRCGQIKKKHTFFTHCKACKYKTTCRNRSTWHQLKYISIVFFFLVQIFFF